MAKPLSTPGGLLLSLGCALLIGCSSGAGPYQEVSESAGFQGPISDGISFSLPRHTAAPVGRSFGDEIHSQEHGLKPGSYLVRISSAERLPNPNREDAMTPALLSRERITARFNTKSTIVIEVRAGEPSELDLELQ